jgi:hypothetical protein
MPFIPGQVSGLIAGFVIIAIYTLIYAAIKLTGRSERNEVNDGRVNNKFKEGILMEFSEELTQQENEKKGCCENKDKE